MANNQPATIRAAIIRLMEPITFTVLLILIGVTLLIALNVIGWDSGNVLRRMSTHEFARGLITYLFAITTIGTAVVLVMAALMREIDQKAYARGKEILSLLLGVFGTIVGFYFGAETGATRGADEVALVQPHLSAPTVAAGGTVTVTTSVTGGLAPYLYGIGVGENAAVTADRPVARDGWIVATVTAPPGASELVVMIAVEDAEGDRVSTRSVIPVTSAAAPPPPGSTPAP